MAIQFGCQCGQPMSVRDEFAGKQIRCPQCSAVLTVPGSAVPAASGTGTAASAAGPSVAGLPPVQPPGMTASTSAKAPNATAGPDDINHLPPVQAWSYANATDFTLVALTADALWIGDKNEVDLPNLVSYLNGGGDPVPVFAERGLRIDLRHLHVAEADKHSHAVDVQYQLADNRAVSRLDFASQPDRNVFFASLQARLGPSVVMETEKVPAWKAGVKPLAWTAFAMFITLMFYLGARQLISGETEAEIRGSKKFLKLIAYWIIDLVGPNGVLIIGALLVVAGVIWFVIRAQKPPILVRLKRPAA